MHKVADFRTEKEEQEKERGEFVQERAGTRWAICSSFALITATKCLAFPSATRPDDRGRYRHTADPKTTAENWNRSFTSDSTDLTSRVCNIDPKYSALESNMHVL